MSGEVDLPDNPFPGLEPYSFRHSALLYRRDKEKRALFRRMIMYRGTLLYGDQGVGKSSLVNAGLAPLAIEEGFQPYWIRVQPTPNHECVVDAPPIGDRSLDWLALGRTRPEQSTNVTIAAADLPRAVREQGNRKLLLIFDQFEEWITLFGKTPSGDSRAVHKAQTSVRDAVVELLLDPKVSAKVLLSFREDYLARMEPIFDEVPDLPDQYVRLAPLTNDQLRDSILGPFQQYKTKYEPPIGSDLAGAIVSALDEQAPHRHVEAAEVQIVCHDLFEGRADGESYADAYKRLGWAKGLFDAYFQSKLDAITEDKREPAIALFARLVQDNHRNVVSEDNLLRLVELSEKMDRKLLENTLEVLVDDTKLVKRQNREGVDYIEIASEFLIEWIHETRSEQQERRHKDELSRQRLRYWFLVIPIAALVWAFLGFQFGSRSSDAPPTAEVESIVIPGFGELDASLLFDGDEETPLVIPVGDERQIKVEVTFKDVIDIVDVSVVPHPEGLAPKTVFIQKTRIEVPVGDQVQLAGRGAYGRTDSLTLIVEVHELDSEVRIAELKFWRRELE